MLCLCYFRHHRLHLRALRSWATTLRHLEHISDEGPHSPVAPLSLTCLPLNIHLKGSDGGRLWAKTEWHECSSVWSSLWCSRTCWDHAGTIDGSLGLSLHTHTNLVHILLAELCFFHWALISFFHTSNNHIHKTSDQTVGQRKRGREGGETIWEGMNGHNLKKKRKKKEDSSKTD